MVAYVRKACIDLYNQHRVDPETICVNLQVKRLNSRLACLTLVLVQENLEVVKVQLSSEELSEIRQIINSSEIIGERYTATKKLVNVKETRHHVILMRYKDVRNTLKKLKNSNMKRDCSHFQIKSLQENQVDQLSRNSENSPRNPQSLTTSKIPRPGFQDLLRNQDQRYHLQYHLGFCDLLLHQPFHKDHVEL
ncbi:hypothetical protein RhiirC2_866917 [Rhizophagus irregularis]|uniref:Uncharacterized protein n=1 Tax=Rhizophagus irregularis TaxID=588596 RepID=A0A2N1N5A9_9GLOM|nr:hypothetical protein RhiirC2_866917 [Rhizophagus irregularis]